MNQLTDAAPVAHERSFRAIGTTNRVLATRPDVLDEAEASAREFIADLDAAVSRFREDSEVSRLARAAEHGPASAEISPTFAGSLRAALRIARRTGGLVDPTVGAAVIASGYDEDMDAIRARDAGLATASAAQVPGWGRLAIDPVTDALTVPRGVVLDLGATAKAYAADRIAEQLSRHLPGGFLVNLGGDIAISGEAPAGGWLIGLDDGHGGNRQVIASTGAAVATSSTRLRTWATADGQGRHHIIDPRSGTTANTPWADVTCVAATALEANAASTAAIVLGDDAPGWLQSRGIPARLDAVDGRVVTTDGWPVGGSPC